jgi:hypothetical protein
LTVAASPPCIAAGYRSKHRVMTWREELDLSASRNEVPAGLTNWGPLLQSLVLSLASRSEYDAGLRMFSPLILSPAKVFQEIFRRYSEKSKVRGY